MIVSRRTALLGSGSDRIMRAAGQAASPAGLRSIMQRQITARTARLVGTAGARQITADAGIS